MGRLSMQCKPNLSEKLKSKNHKIGKYQQFNCNTI